MREKSKIRQVALAQLMMGGEGRSDNDDPCAINHHRPAPCLECRFNRPGRRYGGGFLKCSRRHDRRRTNDREYGFAIVSVAAALAFLALQGKIRLPRRNQNAETAAIRAMHAQRRCPTPLQRHQRGNRANTAAQTTWGVHGTVYGAVHGTVYVARCMALHTRCIRGEETRKV